MTSRMLTSRTYTRSIYLFLRVSVHYDGPERTARNTEELVAGHPYHYANLYPRARDVSTNAFWKINLSRDTWQSAHGSFVKGPSTRE